jgi:aminopeptidase YwaD
MDMNSGRAQIGKNIPFLARIICVASLSFHSFHEVNSQEPDCARRIVEDLAGPSMHGRGFVFNGVGKAARYIARSFEEKQAMPVNGSYSEYFRLDVNTFPGPVRLSVNGNLLKPATDYLPDPSSPGIKGRFGLIEIHTEDILSGIFLDKIRNATKHHLLYLNFPDKDSLDPGLKKKILAFRAQVKNDTQIQASGIIEVTGEKLSWYSSGNTCSKPWIIVDKAVKLDSLSQLDININNRFLTGRRARNIVGVINGNLKPDSFIMFTAHYDHIGSLGRRTFFPGANDNASGVAMLLSLMKNYAAHPPSYSILFLATSAEELGLLGASHFVGHLPIDPGKIRFLINLTGQPVTWHQSTG